MKYWLALMVVPEHDQLIDLARHAEACGFHGVTYADHLIMPTAVDTPYPYSESGEMFWPIEAPWPDPWITLSVLAAHTTTLHLATNIYLAALRDPFTVARAVATASVFSHGRVVCGISAGWLKEEYDAAGIDFASRGRRLDEILAICRRLWAGERFAHTGEHFRFDEVILRPTPPASVPVWAGGMSKPALRRAALNDGWLGLPLGVAENLEIVARLHAIRQEHGLPLDNYRPCISLAEAMTPDAIARLEAGGIGDMVVMPWMPNPWENERFAPEGADLRDVAVKKAAISRFAERVIGA
ncbi:TIGR03619 family F420-dependent LLM class oxidoreductase [Sphingomonas jatrophae]|uniref:Probable F420-dependent oxidoreductase, Rv2161c family n=1 Tax=Sphingomonas jatrophae TaxID=1166337 RepID=A0A1I6KEP5_9SPHN|nr:TIGR03619 family F420-dependent LLM class oxidoreductase [Sphingomonas jatrophae]SFR89712.1 probable F420-dependent oxidoreductase, Rv2161c family [Sphingomonas jatrophae]